MGRDRGTAGQGEKRQRSCDCSFQVFLGRMCSVEDLVQLLFREVCCDYKS